MSLPNKIEPDELARLAYNVRVRGWALPVVIFLQAIAPLGFLCSQVVTMLAPLATPQGRACAQRWAELLEDRQQLERLQQLIEMQDAT